ncbi:MAG TPA: hypothetical protein VF753_17360 [Terriglobales bacterium]
MSMSVKGRIAAVCLFALVAVAACQFAVADDVVHAVDGVVKHIDKDGKTMVVKAADGTEHTIKWTDKTTWKGMKDTGKGIDEGSKVSVKYTEKAGEKTAVGVKDLGKDMGKAME